MRQTLHASRPRRLLAAMVRATQQANGLAYPPLTSLGTRLRSRNNSLPPVAKSAAEIRSVINGRSLHEGDYV
jgi:hypothetical protein